MFVDGCFWHCCPTHQTWPKTNTDWWADKLRRNVTRDRETDDQLGAAGWAVIRVWEHEDPGSAADRIESVVRERRRPSRRRPGRSPEGDPSKVPTSVGGS